MGIGEEFLAGMMADEQAEELHFEQLLKNKIWESSDGTLYKVNEMDMQYIQNVINFINKKRRRFLGYADDFIKMFNDELTIRQNPKSLLDGSVIVKVNGNEHKIKVRDLITLIKEEEQ